MLFLRKLKKKKSKIYWLNLFNKCLSNQKTYKLLCSNVVNKLKVHKMFSLNI